MDSIKGILKGSNATRPTFEPFRNFFFKPLNPWFPPKTSSIQSKSRKLVNIYDLNMQLNPGLKLNFIQKEIPMMALSCKSSPITILWLTKL